MIVTPASDQPARFRSVTENTGTPIVEKVREIKYYKYVGFLNMKSIFLFPHFLFLFSYKLLGENMLFIFLDPNKEHYYISTFDTKYKTKKTNFPKRLQKLSILLISVLMIK